MKPVYYKKNGVVNKVAGVSVPIPYPADDVSYDNTTSQLEATDVQSAIDELSQKEAGVQSDWNETDNTKLDYIKNKPTIPDPQIQSDWTQSDDTAKDFIKNKPSIPAAQIQSDWSQSDNTQLDYIKNKPSNLVQDASYVHTDNNYTSTEKTKLGTIAEGAEVNVQSDWNQTDTDADDFIKNKPTIPDAQIQSDWNQTSGTAKDFIKNKPTLGTASALDVATSGDASSSQVVKGDDSRLTDARTPISHTHTLSEITDAGTAASKNSTSSVTAGSTDLVESGAVKTAIDNAVSGAYKHAGTKTCAELISSLLIASNNGNVYNITDSGTTTSDFIEGAGIPIRAGDNVGIAKISDSIYKFDLLSGFIDTSNFVTKSSTSGLIKNDGSIDTTEYAPASSIPAAQIQSDWSQSDNTKLDYIKNKPTLGTAAAKNVPVSGNASTSEVVLGNDSRLTDARNAADVYEWAKASAKPSYTKSEVGLGNVDNTSDSTKKSNFTGSIASENMGFVTGGDAYTALNGKVDKVDGKDLSSNDYTTTEKNKLAGIASGAEVNVQSDWNQTNTSSDDYIKNKPSNLVQDDSYVHTDNNYTTTEKNKLAGIASGAEVNVQSDWNQTTTGSDDYIKNKPTKLSQFTNDSGFTKVESSTTNGNIKIDTVETQVYDDSEIQNLVDTSLTETEYANPLSLTTDNAQNAVDTKIKIEPIQDLHGYDKPWVGGAGKNKLEITSITKISGGITFTVVKDDANNITKINIKGLSTAETYYLLNNQSLENGEYEVSGGAEVGKYFIYVNGNKIGGGQTSLAVTLSNTRFTVDSSLYTSYDVGIGVFNNVNLNAGYDLYPMIRLASESNTFAPYSNICPISGHDQIDILGCGVNIWNEEWELGDYSSTNGEPVSDSNRLRSKSTDYIRIAPSAGYIKVGNGTVKAYLCFYDKNKAHLSSITANGVFSIPQNAEYMRFCLERTYGTTYNNDIIIALGSDAIPYSPYQSSNNLSLALPSTVYGGVLDLESSELQVTHKVRLLTNSDTWYIDARWNNCFYTAWTRDGYAPSRFGLDAISSQYHSITGDVEELQNGDFIYDSSVISGSNNSMVVKNEKYTTVNEFKDSLTNNPIQICYELATPTTIHLTPSQLYLLKNQNNLTTSQYTQIKVIYRNGIFALLDPATETTDGLMSAMDKVKLDSINTENVSLDLLSHAIVLQRI